MENIRWMDKVRNVEVLEKVWEKRKILETIRKRTKGDKALTEKMSAYW